MALSHWHWYFNQNLLISPQSGLDGRILTPLLSDVNTMSLSLSLYLNHIHDGLVKVDPSSRLPLLSL